MRIAIISRELVVNSELPYKNILTIIQTLKLIIVSN